MNTANKTWAKELFIQSCLPMPLQALAAKMPPRSPAPPSVRDLMVPPELVHEMALIDAYAANAEEYGYESAPTLESLKDLLAHLSTLKNGGAA